MRIRRSFSGMALWWRSIASRTHWPCAAAAPSIATVLRSPRSGVTMSHLVTTGKTIALGALSSR